MLQAHSPKPDDVGDTIVLLSLSIATLFYSQYSIHLHLQQQIIFYI
jgi:hypothetical protein